LNGAALSCVYLVVLDRSVAKPILNAPRVVAGVGEGIATGMAQHVGVDGEGKTGAHADALDQAINRTGGERTTALGGEDKSRIGRLPAQLAQRSHLVAAQWARRGLAVLGAADVQRGIAA
jgi:hypothetical protein